MAVGRNRSNKAEINVTPMIDVLLVLLVIFMMITPEVPKGLSALLPQDSPQNAVPPPPSDEIVVTIHRGGAYQLNQEPVDFATLRIRLADLFKNGANQVVFVRGDKDLEFRSIAGVIDMARSTGVFRVALMTN